MNLFQQITILSFTSFPHNTDILFATLFQHWKVSQPFQNQVQISAVSPKAIC